MQEANAQNNQKPEAAASSIDEQSLIFTTMPDYKIVVGQGGVKPGASIHMPNRKLSRVGLWLLAIVTIIVAIAVIGYVVISLLNTEEPAEELRTPAVIEQKTETPLATASYSDFLVKYFGSEECKYINVCGQDADPDADGASNQAEFEKGYDPNNADSDLDGLADGDEQNIFELDPLKPKSTISNLKDLELVKGFYSSKQPDRQWTQEEMVDISGRIAKFGFHNPSLKTLEDAASIYSKAEFAKVTSITGTSTAGTGTVLGLTTDPEDQLNRDTQRLSTISKLGIALEKYKAKIGGYPEVFSMAELNEELKPFFEVATNIKDPVNVKPYVYDYKYVHPNDFLMSYFSETQNLLIKYTSKNAVRDYQSEDKKSADEQRKRDVEAIKTALLLYSAANVSAQSRTLNIFPSAEKLKEEISPKYLGAIPRDPKTGKDYEYKVTSKLDKFTVKALLDDPPSGYTGFFCNQEDECDYY